MNTSRTLHTIPGLSLNSAKNEVVHTFNQLFIPELEQCSTLIAKFPEQVQNYLSAAQRYEDCLLNHRFSELTERVQGIDAWSDRKWTALRYLIIAAAESTDPARREAGRRLKKIFDSFGKVRRMGYAQQSGTMSSLCKDILQNHHAEAELIGILPVVEDLQQTNQEFLATFDERVDSKAEHDKGETRLVKSEVITSYRALISLANIEIYTNGIDGFETFVKNTTRLVEDFRLMVGQKPVETKPGDGTESEKKKFRYAEFMNGEELVAKFQCEVGKAIPKVKIPEPPEGMKWEGIPTKMPDEDIVILAVPKNQQPEDFTPEQLRDFPIYPNEYGAVTEITNPNSLISPFNPLSINYKLSNLLPGTPAPTEGEVPEGKAKVKFDREAEEEERKRLDRDIEHLKERGLIQHDSGLLKDVEENVADTKSFCLWYDLGSSVQSQGFVPECLTGFHWDIPQLAHVLDTAHYTIKVVKDEDEDENENEDEDLTPGMDWPSDVPAPEGWTIVIFRDKDGRETVKLYRNGSSVYSQGGYPENAPGYEWIGIHAILNGTTHTITEYEE